MRIGGIAESDVFGVSNGAMGANKKAPMAAILKPRARAFTPVNEPNVEGLKSGDYRH